MSAETEPGPPVDLVAVAADDALLDALTAGARASGAMTAARTGSPRIGTDPLAALLAGWRAELDARPMPAPSPAEDRAMIDAAAGGAARRRRWPAPVGAAAAALVVALAGTGALVHQARPGDALWGVTQVVFADRARSVEAAVDTDADLTRAQQAVAQGRTADADAALQAAGVALRGVADPQGAQQLRDRLDALTSARAAAAGPGAGAATTADPAPQLPAPQLPTSQTPAPQLPTSVPGGPDAATSPAPGPPGPPSSTASSPTAATSPSSSEPSTRTPSNTQQQQPAATPSTGPESSRNATPPTGGAAPAR